MTTTRRSRFCLSFPFWCLLPKGEGKRSFMYYRLVSYLNFVLRLICVRLCGMRICNVCFGCART
jgi:hypothetical protein